MALLLGLGSVANATDPYEDDNTANDASVIVLNVKEAPPTHAFDVAGDQDWVKFYALSGVTYEARTVYLGSRCDTVLTLYGPDGTTVITTVNAGGAGQDELLSWECDTEGVYYVKVNHFDPSIYGEETNYDLRVRKVMGVAWMATIKGIATDAVSGEPIGGLRIKTNANMSALGFEDGSYLMIHPAGTWNMTAQADGYEIFTDTLIATQLGTITKNFAMEPTPLRGDINYDRRVDLVDAILALRVVSNGDTQGLIRSDYGTPGIDANGDGKIGPEDAIYILQLLAN
jgi:hypothetical protein